MKEMNKSSLTVLYKEWQEPTQSQYDFEEYYQLTLNDSMDAASAYDFFRKTYAAIYGEEKASEYFD